MPTVNKWAAGDKTQYWEIPFHALHDIMWILGRDQELRDFVHSKRLEGMKNFDIWHAARKRFWTPDEILGKVGVTAEQRDPGTYTSFRKTYPEFFNPEPKAEIESLKRLKLPDGLPDALKEPLEELAWVSDHLTGKIDPKTVPSRRAWNYLRIARSGDKQTMAVITEQLRNLRSGAETEKDVRLEDDGRKAGSIIDRLLADEELAQHAKKTVEAWETMSRKAAENEARF